MLDRFYRTNRPWNSNAILARKGEFSRPSLREKAEGLDVAKASLNPISRSDWNPESV